MLRRTMQLGHTEAIKQAVMAGLGVAFVSRYAVRGEVATRRLAVVPVRGLKIQRHFHVIHNETRGLAASPDSSLTRRVTSASARLAGGVDPSPPGSPGSCSAPSRATLRRVLHRTGPQVAVDPVVLR